MRQVEKSREMWDCNPDNEDTATSYWRSDQDQLKPWSGFILEIRVFGDTI